ncbi:histidine kinase [Siphonobacter sp. BAB-5385]|uniref:sensor histidine kinase n=1 Tax=Siphonobacter sp. BAB-5385 TaxID=1864822 RepID=UPI000B9DE970|nr:sensor histidine kinase [Siphonobacter sp. BAB-5385]OZI08722.1 histidine kinase [Siphonobacter sp. BAB-5385]
MTFSLGFLITTVVVSVLLVILAGFIIFMTIRHQQRYRQHQEQQQSLKEAFNRELLESQIEIQNSTLQHISEELHDNIGQLLTVVRLGLYTLRNKTSDVTLKQEVNEVNDLLQVAVQAVRDVTKTLNSEAIESFGLYESVVFETDRIRKASQKAIEVKLDGTPYALPDRQDLMLFRMVQEILSNALKHARASQIEVHFSYRPHTLAIRIADNGEGFLLHQPASLSTSGLGLKNLHRRVDLLKGNLNIDSKPQQGTRVTIDVPISA